MLILLYLKLIDTNLCQALSPGEEVGVVLVGAGEDDPSRDTTRITRHFFFFYLQAS